MTLKLFWRCDRCDTMYEHNREKPIEVSVLVTAPMPTDGWHICSSCLRSLRGFMNPPRAAEPKQ